MDRAEREHRLLAGIGAWVLGHVLLIVHRPSRDEPVANDSVDRAHPPDSWHTPFVVR